MKIEVVFVGKTSDKHFGAAIDDYIGRIGHYLPVKLTVIPAIKNTKNLSEEQQKKAEGDLILANIGTGDMLVLSDERGKEFRSVDFARWIEGLQQHVRKMVMVIGGPYGFSQEVYARADAKVSLSKMTFSHQMVRLILVEQLYRACTIIKGEPYHHE